MKGAGNPSCVRTAHKLFPQPSRGGRIQWLTVRRPVPARCSFQDTTMKQKLCWLALLATLSLTGAAAWSAEPGTDPKAVQAVVDKAAAYLRGSQGPDGSFSPHRAGPGITAVV